MANTGNVEMTKSQYKMSDPELNNDVMLYYNSWNDVTFVWILYKYGYEFHNLFLGLYQSASSVYIYVYMSTSV